MRKNVFVFVGLAFIAFSCNTQSDFAPDEVSYYPDNFVTEKAIKSLLSEAFEEPVTRRDGKSTFARISSSKEIMVSDGLPAFYIMNFEGGGFIILSADNRLNPILAFSDVNSFPTSGFEDFNGGLLNWMESTKSLVQYLRSSDEVQENEVAVQWQPEIIAQLLTPSHSHDDIGSMVETRSYVEQPNVCTCGWVTPVSPLMDGVKFRQSNPWNECAPLVPYNGTMVRAAVGCGALAMGQIARFWEHPETYTHNSNTSFENYGTTYTLDYANLYNTANGMPRVFRICGDLLFNSWGATGTSNNFEDITPSLHIFGFYSSYKDYNISDTRSSLDQGRPVILCGGRKETTWLIPQLKDGHGWVTDGYRKYVICSQHGSVSHYYLNMLWGQEHPTTHMTGYCDGWYDERTWNPQYTVAAGYIYDYHRKMNYNIYPSY